MSREEKLDTAQSLVILVTSLIMNALGYFFMDKNENDVAPGFFFAGLLFGMFAIVHGVHCLRKYGRE